MITCVEFVITLISCRLHVWMRVGIPRSTEELTLSCPTSLSSSHQPSPAHPSSSPISSTSPNSSADLEKRNLQKIRESRPVVTPPRWQSCPPRTPHSSVLPLLVLLQSLRCPHRPNLHRRSSTIIIIPTTTDHHSHQSPPSTRLLVMHLWKLC